MSDDLTERLREWWDYDHGRLIEQALDRIEELEAELETCKKYRDAYAECDRISTHALRKAVEVIHFVYNSLHEINPSNYDHDDVCILNDKSVEAIIALSSTLAELKG